MKTSTISRRWSVAALAIGLLLAAGVHAQDDKHAAREREALRRAQQALRSAQEQQATLRHEKAALSAERDKLDEAARRSASQLVNARAEATRLRTERARAETEREQLRAELEVQRSAGAGREQALQVRGEELARALQDTRRLLAERTQSLAAVRSLLERSTAALVDAEAKNRELYAIGNKLVDELRERGAPEGLFGFDRVRLENRAESLRSEIDAQRLTGGAAR